MGFRQLHINAGQVDNHHLPDTFGNNGDVLTSHGDGTTSWSALWTSVSLDTFYPEFPNMTKINDTTNNTIDINLLNSGTDNWENYYEIITAQATMQDMDLYISYRIPQDFASFDTNNAIDVIFSTETITDTDNKLDIAVYKSGTGAAIATDSGLVSDVAETKKTNSITAADLAGGSFAAGDLMIIFLKPYSADGNYVRIYSVAIKYNK